MKSRLCSKMLAMALILGLVMAPVASAQAPGWTSGAGAADDSWTFTLWSWWLDLWGDLGAGDDELVSHPGAESTTTTTDPSDPEVDSEDSGEQTEPLPDNGPGLDPLGGS